MKGFKKDGKFRPTEKRNKSSVKKQDIVFKKPISFEDDEFKKKKMGATIQEQKTINTWSYDDAPTELKEKIIEKLREWEYEHGDNWYAENDGILYDTDNLLAGHEIFKDVIPKAWDLDYDKYIQFELEFIDNNPDAKYSMDSTTAQRKLGKYLGLTPKMQENIELKFDNPREHNTQIDFLDLLTGYEMDVFTNYDEYLEEVKDNDEITKSQRFTESQFDKFDEAQEKWDTLMKKSFHNLRDEYEYKFTDQALIETADGNDWNFDEDGNQV